MIGAAALSPALKWGAIVLVGYFMRNICAMFLLSAPLSDFVAALDRFALDRMGLEWVPGLAMLRETLFWAGVAGAMVFAFTFMTTKPVAACSEST